MWAPKCPMRLNEGYMPRERMIEIVRILTSDTGDLADAAVDDLLIELERLSPDPNISQYIFWPDQGEERLTPEQIVDMALVRASLVSDAPK